jgi:enoyl-CoA hydratase/carnithine racemase
MPFEFITLKAMGDIVVVTLNRPDKRNAIHEALLVELDTFFSKLPITAKAVVLTGNGPHFCAALEFMHMCQAWHRVFDKIQYGGIPVVGALHGAVVGGGLELAAATHIRVADPSTYFALPEGQKGIFTGGGATMRVARIISPSRMVEMMLTGRVVDAAAGLNLGLAHEISAPGAALSTAISVAKRVAKNAELSSYAMVTCISRIADMSATDGMFAESLMAAVVQTGSEVQSRLGTFVDKSLPKITFKKNRPERRYLIAIK